MNERRESPVAEALRKIKMCENKTCEMCEHFEETNDDGYTINWCYYNDTEVELESTCDDFSEENWIDKETYIREQCQQDVNESEG